MLCRAAGCVGMDGEHDSGGRTALADFADIALDGRTVVLAFDGDVGRKPEVQNALERFAEYLTGKGATVHYLHLPDTDEKTGMDDYLMTSGNGTKDLVAPVKPYPPAISVPNDFAPTPAVAQAIPHIERTPARYTTGHGYAEPAPTAATSTPGRVESSSSVPSPPHGTPLMPSSPRWVTDLCWYA
jgi:hypothetical protein